MGSSFLITKSMLKDKSKELMLNFYNHIHDDLSFDETKSQKKFYEDNIINIYKKIELPDHKLFKYLESYATYVVVHKDHIDDEYLKKEEIKEEKLLEYIEKEIKNKTINTIIVYKFMSKMDEELKLDKSSEFEINEDLFCLKKAFLKAYELFYHDGYNLED